MFQGNGNKKKGLGVLELSFLIIFNSEISWNYVFCMNIVTRYKSCYISDILHFGQKLNNTKIVDASKNLAFVFLPGKKYCNIIHISV